MRDLRYILIKADKILKNNLKKELRDQGHFNTGALEASFVSNVTMVGDDMRVVGSALNYANILNDGTRPEKASFAQFPFVVKFFQSKGYELRQAQKYAAMTIHKWMKEGMSTKASVRFSKNGKRLNFIGLVKETMATDVDKVILQDIDKEIQKEFRKTKSGTF